MESMNKALIVLVPSYNAASTLEELIHRIRRSMGNVQVVIIDDGSTDRTGEVADFLGAIVLRHDRNRGKGAALQTGFDFVKRCSETELVLTIDADLQHRPEDIQRFFLVQQQTGADVVVGWREKIGTSMPIHRILSNTITSAMVGMRTGVKIKDSQCGFRLINRRVVENVQLDAAGYEAETEFLIKAAKRGFKIEFAPVRTVYGSEKSYMTHWTTTMNFIKVLFRDYA